MTDLSLGGGGRGMALLRPPRAGYTGHGKGEAWGFTVLVHSGDLRRNFAPPRHSSGLVRGQKWSRDLRLLGQPKLSS